MKRKSRHVYVVEGVYHYESSNVLGVYSTKQRAQAAADLCENGNLVSADGRRWNRCSHDEHPINRYKVNE